MVNESKGKKRLITRLRNKYRLVILNDDTFEEKLSLKLSRLNVFLLGGFSSFFLVGATIFIIAFTPLREYIPGYSSTRLKQKAYQLALVTDSLETQLFQNEKYLLNLQRIIQGKPPLSLTDTVEKQNIEDIQLNNEVSAHDSALREFVEQEERFALPARKDLADRESISFFTPIKGLIVTPYNLKEAHYGVDVVADAREIIKSCQEGVVIFSEWTVETGYVLVIQHPDNFLSVYKHNSALLKKQGALVKAGEPIAIVGNTGELTTGPHLHFELWFKGNPVNPTHYISF